jgi:hypothetical protein
MRFLTRIRPCALPCLIGFAVGAAFACVWLGILGREPVPVWLLAAIGAAGLVGEPAVAWVRRRHSRRGRPRRAHARPTTNTRKDTNRA